MAKTIGMADVACFAAGTALPTMTMTATLSRTSSAAISATTVASIFDRDGATLDPAEFAAAAAFRSSSPTTPAAQRISEDKRRLAGGPAELGHLITFDPRDEPQVVHAIDPQWRQDVICGAVHISPA
jgi:hypothetical protein